VSIGDAVVGPGTSIRQAMPSGLTVTFSQHRADVHCEAVFDAARYDPKGVRELMGHAKRLLAAIPAGVDRPVEELLRQTRQG
jgi:hypothetical protein